MSTSVAPALETAGGSVTSGSSGSSADPIDSLDLSSLSTDSGVDLPSEITIDESQIIPGRQPRESKESKEQTDARADGRNDRGQFSKKETEAPAETAPVAATPFRYRAMGNTHELQGATLDASGNAVIPAAKVPELREAMNALHLAKGDFIPTIERHKADNAKLQSEITQLRESRTMADSKAEQLVNSLTAIMQEPDDTKALNALWSLRGAWPQLTSRAEAEYWRQQAEAGKAAPPVAPNAHANTTSQPAGMPAPETAQATTMEWFEQAKIDHQFKDLTPADWKQLEARYRGQPFAFLRLATAEHAQQYGIQPNTPVFDTDALWSDIQQHATSLTAQREAAKRTTDLAARNARTTAPSINAPPSPGGGSAPAASKPGFKSKQDINNWFDSDEI